MHRPHGIEILVDHRSGLCVHVRRYRAGDHGSGEGRHRYRHRSSHAHAIPQRFISEDQYLFHQHDRMRVDHLGFETTIVARKIVDRHRDGLTRAQGVKMRDQQIVVERVGMIEIATKCVAQSSGETDRGNSVDCLIKAMRSTPTRWRIVCDTVVCPIRCSGDADHDRLHLVYGFDLSDFSLADHPVSTCHICGRDLTCQV